MVVIREKRRDNALVEGLKSGVAVPRGGIRKKKTKKQKKKHRSRSKSGVALCHGVPPSRSLLAPFPRSLLLNRTETLASRAMADRESSIALCHGMALKKKGSVEDRESVSLCATRWR